MSEVEIEQKNSQCTLIIMLVSHPLEQIISLSCHKSPPGLFAQYDTVHFGGKKQVSIHRGQTIHFLDNFGFFQCAKHVNMYWKNLNFDDCLTKFGSINGKTKL